LKFCPFCGKALLRPQPDAKSTARDKDHFKSMEHVDGGYMLSLGDDPIVATPAMPVQPIEPTKPAPAKPHAPDVPKPSSHQQHRHHHPHPRPDHPQPKVTLEPKALPITPVPPAKLAPPPPPPSPQPPALDDTADLLSLDLDLVKAEEEIAHQQFEAAPPVTHAVPDKPTKLKHVNEPKPPPTQAARRDDKDEMVLPMLSEPSASKVAPQPPQVKAPRMDDTLAGLVDEEDQLNLAEAEEVVDLSVEQDDDDLKDMTGGLVVTDVEDDLDYEIKPEETVPVVGLNMLQQHVGKASSWDRVPLPELAASDQSSVYELAVEPEVAAGKVCPACNAQMPFDAVVCATCGYSTQLGRYVAGVSGDPMGDRYDGSERYTSESEKYEEDQEYYHRQHMMQDVYLPSLVLLAMLVLLVFTVVAVCPYEMVNRDIVERVIPSKIPVATVTAPLPGSNAPGMGGIAVNFMAGMKAAPPPPPLTTRQKWFCIAYLFGTNLLEIAIKIPFMFLGMLLIVRLFGVSFGGIFSALTKMLAIAMAAHVMAYLIEAIMFILTEGLPTLGMDKYVSFPFAVITFIGLNMKFFELDIQEGIVLYLASYLMPMFASMIVLMWVVAMLS
jgi:ribosomal protein L40E